MTISNVDGLTAVPSARRSGTLQRILGVIVSPVETFREIGRDPNWVLPLILITVLTVAAAAIISPRLDVEGPIRAKMSGRHASEETIERMVQAADGVRRFSVVITVFTTPVSLLMIAGIVALALILSGVDVAAGRVLSVVCYAWMPQIIKGLCAVIIVIARRSVTMDELESIVRSNPAFLVNPVRNAPLAALLSSFDLFTFWTMALMVIGFSVALNAPTKRILLVVSYLWMASATVKLIAAMYLVRAH
jgi:hypothetical protein